MSSQALRLRTWSDVFATNGDKAANVLPKQHRTPSKYNSSLADRKLKETNIQHELRAEDLCNKQISERTVSSQEVEGRQPNMYDEKAFADALKDINNEIESLRLLYNSQWFTDMRKASDKNKNRHQGVDPEMFASNIKSNELPGETLSNDVIYLSKKLQNNSGIRHTTALNTVALIKERQSAIKGAVDEQNWSQKKIPSYNKKQSVGDKQVHKKIFEIPSDVPLSPGAAIGTEKRIPIKTNMFRVITEETEEDNSKCIPPNDTQKQLSVMDNKMFYKTFSELHGKIDDITNMLTEVERQTFMDAIYMMNEEAANTDKEAYKETTTLTVPQTDGSLNTSKMQIKLEGTAEKMPRGLSYTSAKKNVRGANQQVDLKTLNSGENLHNLGRVRRAHNIPTDTQKHSIADSLIKKNILEKQKVANEPPLKSITPKSLLPCVLDKKKGDLQADSEVCSQQINPNAPLVSRHYATKKMSSKCPPKGFRQVALKSNIR